MDIAKVIVTNDEKHTLIFYAIKIKNEENWLKMVKVLVENFALKANYTDVYDQTLLFYAWREGYTSLVEYLIKDWKLDINHRDTYKQTPIYYACRENKLPTLILLLSLNADIKVIDNQGQTPLFYASKKGHLEICKLLVEKGVDINHKDNKSTSAIQIAQKSNKYEIVNYLEEQGAEVPATWKNNKKFAKKKAKASDKIESEPQNYVLSVLKNGRYVMAKESDFNKDFAAKFPDLYKCLKDNDIEGFKNLIPIIDFPDDIPIYISWPKVALRILNHLK